MMFAWMLATALVVAPAAAQSAPDKRTYRLNLPTDRVVKIPVERVKGMILIPARIGGRDVRLVYDNGADATLIDDGVAKAAGLAVTPSPRKLSTGLSVMAVGQTTAEVVVGSTLKIGGTLHTADLTGMSDALGVPVAGVLGGDVAGLLIVVLDPVRNWIAFGLPGRLKLAMDFTVDKPAATGASPTPDEAAVRAALQGKSPVIVPFDRQYRVAATINDQPVSLKIDYGHSGTISLRDDIWQRVIPAADRKGAASFSTRADGGRLPTQHGVARTMKLGSITARDLPITGQAAHRGPYEGLLGLAILARSTTVLNAPKGQLWFLPPGVEADVSATSPEATAAAVPK